MRKTVGSIVVCALFACPLFTLGCEEAEPTDMDGWRGSPGVSRTSTPTADATADKPMTWEKLPPLRTSLPPKFIVGTDLRPLVLHSDPQAAAGQTPATTPEVSNYDGQAWVRRPAASVPSAAGAAPARPGGPAQFPPTATWDARLAQGSDGTTYAAWTDEDDGRRLRVARWNGTTWASPGGFDIAAGSVLRDLAVDTSGAPWVLWTDEGGTRVNVSRAQPRL